MCLVPIMLPIHVFFFRLLHRHWGNRTSHYSDVIMSTMASKIVSLTIGYSTVYLCADQRKYQSSASLTLVRGIHRWAGNSPHKGPVKRKMFPFDGVIMHYDHPNAREVRLNIRRNITYGWTVNSSPPGHNGRHFADDVLKRIFFNENCCILIQISLKCVCRVPINNNLALVQIMAWRQQATSHNLTNADPVHWRIYAALGRDEF